MLVQLKKTMLGLAHGCPDLPKSPKGYKQCKQTTVPSGTGRTLCEPWVDDPGYDLFTADMLLRAYAPLVSTQPDDVEQAGTTHANTVKASCAASPESRGILQELKRASLSAQSNWKLLYMLSLCMCMCFCNERSRKQVKQMRRAYIAVSSYFCIHLESGVSSSSNTNQSSHTET